MTKHSVHPDFSDRRERLHEIIFEADTPEGKWFDIALLFFIILSVLTVMIETVPSMKEYMFLFYILEWIFTIVFTIEYALRLYVVYKPMKYATSLYGIIDLLSILPTYISLFLMGTQHLAVIRALRLLRVFRIFKMGNFLLEGTALKRSLKASQPKITIFMFFVFVMVCIFGSIMHLIEGGANPAFDSIPRSVYWAIVTLTTVGYGDISPITPLGQFLSSIVMILGYAVIAVPTGIVSAEIANGNGNGNGKIKGKKNKKKAEKLKKFELSNITTQSCKFCTKEGHAIDAVYCKYCGEELNPD